MATVVKRPSGKWQATVRKDRCSQSRSFSKHADAVKWARETELQAERGGLQDTAMRTISEMSLRQVLERYRDDVTSTKRCADNETYAINGFLRLYPMLASKCIKKLTTTDFVAHRDRRIQTMKPATVVRELGWMQHAIDIACTDWGQRVRDVNPVKPVRRPRINNKRERRLQAGEWQALLDAVNEARLPLMKPLLRLALATGMRRGEYSEAQLKVFQQVVDSSNGLKVEVAASIATGNPPDNILSDQAADLMLGILGKYFGPVGQFLTGAAKAGVDSAVHYWETQPIKDVAEQEAAIFAAAITKMHARSKAERIAGINSVKNEIDAACG